MTRREVGGVYCLVAIAFWYWTPGARYVASWFADRAWFAPGLAYYFYADALLLAFVAGAVLFGRPTLRDVLGRAPGSRDLAPIALTVIITFCASGAFVILTMVSLSYAIPSFVQWWLEWSYFTVIHIDFDGSIPVAANAHLASLIVIGPALEEMIFRGYLLRAWSRRWGLWTGILLSSAVFGAIHVDTVAAMLTGVGFALLYLRTQSLWAPFFAHALYNLAVAVWNVLELAGNNWLDLPPTLDDFRSAWWIGVVELFVVVLLVDQILRRGALGALRLPTSAEELGHAADRGGVHG